MQVVFIFYEVHDTSCTLKVTHGLRQGQEEAYFFYMRCIWRLYETRMDLYDIHVNS